MPTTRILAVLFTLCLFHPALYASEKDLNGTWVATSAMQSGEKVSDDFVKVAKMVCTDGKYTASLGDITETGTIKIDRSKKPNTIDMKSSMGQKKGKVMQGLFELEGDTLTICFCLENNQRPKDITSTAANKHWVVVYKRQK